MDKIRNKTIYEELIDLQNLKKKQECNLLYSQKIKMMNIWDNTTLPQNKKKQYNLIPFEDASKFLS